jgi:hypothetical protein
MSLLRLVKHMRDSSARVDNQARAGEKQVADDSGACSWISEKRNQSSGDACLHSNTNSTVVSSRIVAQIFAIGARITDEEQHNEDGAKDEAPNVRNDKALVEEQFGAGGNAEHAEPDDGVGEPKGQKENEQARDQGKERQEQ